MMVTVDPTRGQPSLSDEQLDAIARRFRALSVASRLRVLNALMAGPMPMAELGTATGLSQSNLSRQVTELEQAGCVARDRHDGVLAVRIADPTLRELCELVCGSLEAQAAQTHESLRRGKAEAKRLNRGRRNTSA